MIAEYLQKNNLIICPNVLRKNVVTEINSYSSLISYKVMDLETFTKNYFFSYSKKTIFYLMKKLNLKYEIVLEYLDSLYYIKDKIYQSEKLNELKNIKKELEEKQLLEVNSLFQNYVKQANIIVYGYDDLDPFYEEIFSNFPYFTHLKKINEKRKHTVYEFDDIEDEIAFVCHDIKEKLDQGISIEQIKIIHPSEEYINPLSRIFSWCHIPLAVEKKVSLYSLNIGKEILEKILDNKKIEEIIESCQENLEVDIFNLIVTIFNEYVDFNIDLKEYYSMIEYDLKHTFLPVEHYSNCVSMVDFHEVTSNDYVYVLGFNKENMPVLYKDDLFLSDKMKQELGLFSSTQKNMNSTNTLKNHLNQETNYIITYKLKTFFDSYNPCILIEEEGYSVVKHPKISFQISNFYNQITLAKEYDDFYRFGYISPNINILKSNYPDLEYRTYQNQFTKIDNGELLNNLEKPFHLSYSTIDEYYKCAFRYYISNILKIKEENVDDFYKNIGNIFHAVLSKCFRKDFDFNQAWEEEIHKYDFSINKMFLLEKLKQELKYDIEIIHKQMTYSSLQNVICEKRFTIPIPNCKNIPAHFTGVIDKINYLNEENKTLVSIMDYKTGSVSFNLNNIIHGLGMQLPIYTYLIKRSASFSNVEIVGFYLQKVISKEMKISSFKSVEEQRENALKLVGYSIEEEGLLEKLDETYIDSKMISGLKRKKDGGFYAHSKILSRKQMENMDHLVSKKIEEATNLILNGEFLINPKKMEKDVIGCEYCSYRDLCYKTEKDYAELEKHQHLDFLGGNNDA